MKAIENMFFRISRDLFGTKFSDEYILLFHDLFVQ